MNMRELLSPRPDINTEEITQDPLARVDLCFVVDTTGSMGGFIDAAQRHLTATLDALRAGEARDLQVAIVEYRDHPPQDSTFVTRVHPLTEEPKAIKRMIAGLRVGGGGDIPEAVYDGVHAACTKIAWRPHSLRLALLVGDAPPHGMHAHDPEAPEAGRLCPCGLTLHQVTAAAEAASITLHALCISGHPQTAEAFAAIAAGTGGSCVKVGSQGQAVIEAMRGMVERDLSNLPLDRRALEAARAEGLSDTQRIADVLAAPRGPVAASLARLGKRGLLDGLSIDGA